MTMRWQNVSIPIAQGLDTKTDEKTLPAEKLANLENGVFTKGGTIVKRNGNVNLSNDIINSTSAPTSIRGLHTIDNELLATDSERALSHVPGEDKWVDRGRFKSPKVETEIVDDIDDAQSNADCATLDGVTVYAWEKNGSGIYVTVINEETGAVYLSNTVVSALSGMSRPKVVAAGSHIHVYFYLTGSLYRLLIAPANIESLVSSTPAMLYTELITDIHGSVCRYDVATYSGNVFIAWYTDHGSDKLKLAKYSSSGVVLASTDWAETPDDAISLAIEPNTGRIAITWKNNSNYLWSKQVDSTTLTDFHTNKVDPASSPFVVTNIASAFKRDAAATKKIYAVHLDPSDAEYGYVGVNTAGDDLQCRDDCTFEAWIRFDSLPTGGNSMYILSRDHDSTGKKGYYLRFTDAGTDQLQYGFRDSSGNLETAAVFNWNAPAVNTWFHIAVVHDRDPGTAIFYRDGAAIGSAVTSLDTTTAEKSEAQFRIGGREKETITEYFDGMIRDVRVWSSARSALQISRNYQKEVTGIEADLIGNWRFNKDWLDRSSGENHLKEAYTATQAIFVNVANGTGFDVSSYIAEETEILSGNYPLVIFYEVASGTTYLRYIRKGQVFSSGEYSEGAAWVRHAGLGSKAWADENDVHVNVIHDSLLQSTYFTYMDDGTMIGKFEQGVARGFVTESHLPNVQDLGDGAYQWCGIFRKRLDSTPGVVAATTVTVNPIFQAEGIKRFKMDYKSPQGHEMVKVGRTGYFNGGQVWQYDGSQIVEAGFSMYPENFIVSAATTGSNLDASAEYWYKVYAVWTNANGEVERSTAAAPILHTTGSSTTYRKPTLQIQTIQHTNKDIHFEVYRTLGGPGSNSPFYKVSSDDPTATGANQYRANDKTTDTVTFQDDMTDDIAQTKEVDYQNSGELENVAPPGASVITEGKDRIWLAGLEDTSQIRYSKPKFAGAPVNFNDALSITVPEDGGAITGLRTMNNSLVIFKERAIYAMAGDGPNILGFGQFGSPQLVTMDVGCKTQRSLVETPIGFMFQSSKGIYLLTKQFQTVYVGAEVEDYNANTVTGADISTDRNHVIFTYSDGRALLYDYFFQQWSTFTNSEGTASTFWKDLYCRGTDAGRVSKETPGEYLDAGARIQLKLETAWLKLRGLQGFQRVRRASIVGEFLSSHRLALDVSYNYEDLRRRLIFDAGENVATPVFGTDDLDGDGSAAEFGDGTPFGSATQTSEMESTVYQFRAHLPVQKCQAVKFYFEDIASVGGALAGSYEITELMLEVGTKRGLFKSAGTRNV
jgi:hypothetical protein